VVLMYLFQCTDLLTSPKTYLTFDNELQYLGIHFRSNLNQPLCPKIWSFVCIGLQQIQAHHNTSQKYYPLLRAFQFSNTPLNNEGKKNKKMLCDMPPNDTKFIYFLKGSKQVFLSSIKLTIPWNGWFYLFIYLNFILFIIKFSPFWLN